MLSGTETIQWDRLIQDLERLDPWLEELGVKVKHQSDRLHRGIEILKEAKQEGHLEPGKPHIDVRPHWPDFYLVLSELLELHDILRAFGAQSSGALKTKMERILKGPLSPRDETPDNNQARNTAFELALAAQWHQLGLGLKLQEPDLKAWFDDEPFLVACKRPFSENQIEETVRSAASQIRRELNRHDARNQWGLISISAARILSQGAMIFRARTSQELEGVGDAIWQLLTKHEHRWVTANFDHRIKAILFHCGITAIIEEQSLWSRVAYSVYKPIGQEGPVFTHFKQGLEKAYSSSPGNR